MHGDFCWRQSEDEPTVAYVDVRQLQGVAQKSAVSLGIRAVNNRMPASNHSCPRFQSVVVAARPKSLPNGSAERLIVKHSAGIDRTRFHKTHRVMPLVLDIKGALAPRSYSDLATGLAVHIVRRQAAQRLGPGEHR